MIFNDRNWRRQSKRISNNYIITTQQNKYFEYTDLDCYCCCLNAGLEAAAGPLLSACLCLPAPWSRALPKSRV
jgi:hypothetical protein